MSYDTVNLIRAVTDSESFVEILSLVKGKSSLGEAAGEGVMSGFCTIADRQVALFGMLGNVLGGSIGKKGAKKISILVENAIKSRVPVVGFIDTMGARFAEGIKAMEGYAEIISCFNKAYGTIPVILIIVNKCYGMLTYLLNKCDSVIAFNESQIATLSPLLLAASNKSDLSQVATAKIHSTASGAVSHAVKNEAELKCVLTALLDALTNPQIETEDDANRVCKQLNAKSNAYDVISYAFDKGSFLEIRKDYACGVITGFARLDGCSVGIVAQNSAEGRITADGAKKISSFLKTCNSFALPIINIVNSVGAVNNLADENGRLISDISDMMSGYLNSNGCKVALITGNAMGLGYVAFAGKHIMDYTIAWDSASIGMLTDAACASLLFSDLIANAENKQQLEDELAASYGRDNSLAEVVASEGYLDNVIKPVFTRQYLIAAMRAFYKKGL